MGWEKEMRRRKTGGERGAESRGARRKEGARGKGWGAMGRDKRMKGKKKGTREGKEPKGGVARSRRARTSSEQGQGGRTLGAGQGGVRQRKTGRRREAGRSRGVARADVAVGHVGGDRSRMCQDGCGCCWVRASSPYCRHCLRLGFSPRRLRGQPQLRG